MKKQRIAFYFFLGMLAIGGGIVSAFFSTHENTFSFLSFKSSPKDSELPAPPIAEVKNNYVYYFDAPIPEDTISAPVYYAADLDTGEILFERGGSSVFPIASLTKLMTAVVAKDKLDLDRDAIVSRSATYTESSNGGLRPGDKYKTKDLIYPLLLQSSNDAAETLSEQIRRESFITFMNTTADTLGMNDTSYIDPAGLSPNNLSSPSDIFRLVQHIYKTDYSLLALTQQKDFTANKRTWRNKNDFMGTDGYLGGKTGYTSAAKQTIVSTFSLELDNTRRNIAIIVLRSNNHYRDVRMIKEYISDHALYRKEKPSLTLSVVGDIMMDRGVKGKVYKELGGDYSSLFEFVASLKDSDILFGNLEGSASEKGYDRGSKYSFRMETQTLDVLKEAGFDIFSLANNHILDWGPESARSTLDEFDERDLLYVGAGKNKKDLSRLRIIEEKGISVGFLAFTDVGPAWLPPKEDSVGVASPVNENVEEDIKEASKKVDHLFVSYHWGDEYKPHNERQKELAYLSIDSGARGVIGHHPHVAQDIEFYKDGIIFYSLGNFIFDQYFSEETMTSTIGHLTLNKTNITKASYEQYKINKNYVPEEKIVAKELEIKPSNIFSLYKK
ncbi:MAG: D-alanyl-D-alanine carboxypeptidase/poly-gamma-glutamate capsule biosynthesis protein CapA [Flavobacteriaceae bacterium]|jgi:D-alanyl-D-alanine carboxypeptidase/poly-gamma-glutamate capsule biosynthesis protein CapA/YwtB (metallophosphatase superfamily)